MSKPAPEILPDTYVMELSQANADIVHGDRNGDYTVTFAEPINIQTGDSLSMRMASIDSQKSDSQSVVFADPQPITLNFSYYDNNYNIDNSAGASLLTRRPLDTPAGSFPIDYKLHTSYVEGGNETLDSMDITYTGGAIKVDGFSLGTHEDQHGSVLTQTIVSIESYYMFPLLSWTDENGHHQTSVAKPFNVTSKTKSSSSGETTKLVFTPANNDDPNWKYTYCSTSTNKFDPDGKGDWHPTMSTAQVGQTVGGVTFGSEKITFRPQSLTVTGVIGAVIGHIRQTTASQFGGTETDDERNIASTAFSVGAKNTTVIPSPNRFQMLRRTAGFVLPAGRYDRTTIANLITRKLTQVGIADTKDATGTAQDFKPNSTLVANTGEVDMQNTVFHRIPDNVPSGTNGDLSINDTNTYSYNQSGATVQVGARKFSIEYGQIGQTYQVSNAHQSVENPADTGKENVAYFRTGAGSVPDPFIFNEVNSATGIVVHDLTPENIWRDNLGLYDKWVVPVREDSNGVEYFTMADLKDKFPHESAEIVTFDPTNSRVDTQPSGTNTFIETTTTPTVAVVGDAPVVNVEGAFYLVEITGLNLTQSNMITNDENRANISAIVSKQYDANDIVTGFADSAIPYVHRGTPQMLNSARVRILDPDTREVVTTLGKRNTVFLQLTTGVPVYEPPKDLAPREPEPKTQTK